MHLRHSMSLLSLFLIFSCSTADSSLVSGIDKDNFDITVRPQDDFYRYVKRHLARQHKNTRRSVHLWFF